VPPITDIESVLILSYDRNPAVENQAVDRIVGILLCLTINHTEFSTQHRLGQTKPVTTIKLIIENSIEARLLEVQRKKTELANMTLGQNFSKAEMLQRRMDDLNQLFG
jgi:SWI/SNF-related matrix-associated actin-dependent regulator of chromatin subfamily A3